MLFKMALVNDIQYKMHITLTKISISDFLSKLFSVVCIKLSVGIV